MELIIADMMAKLQKSETFGGRLTEAREEAERWDGNGIGYTQGELADLLRDRCGVEIGRSYISELERSWKQDKMPSLEVARALAAVLRVNLAWLAGVSPNKDPEDAAADLAWQPTTNTISNIIDSWTEDQRQMLLAAMLAEVAAGGPAMLTAEDTAAANAWLRRRVRVFVADNQVTRVRFDFW